MDISTIYKQPEDVVAVSSSSGSITYGELYRRSENLAKHIVASGTKRVIVYGHKEYSMILAYVACLRAGVPYIPVSPQQPVGRRKAIASQANAGLILCAVGRGFAGAGSALSLNIMAASDQPPEEEVQLPDTYSDDQLAYITFTSGSTGNPKGVQATRGNLNNYIDWMDKTIPLKPEEEGTVLNLAMFSIDLSLTDIYYALTHGRTLVTTNSEVQQHLTMLYPHLVKSNAAMMVLPPTLVHFMMQSNSFGRKMMPNLRVVYLSGESLHPGTVRHLLKCFDGDLTVINGYGPTEATCNVCAAQITDDMCDDRLPVGIVKDACTTIRVMKGNEDVPVGEEGEIVLIGKSITGGYTNDDEGGFCTIDGQSAFRTGDIGFVTEEGKLYWSYRKNGMIKVRGVRIEPGDVENHMVRIHGVTGCGVVERYGHLVAYVTVSHEMTPGQIRAAARPHLPTHMIPGIVRIVDSLPMTENGKLDRDQLE